MVCSPKENSSNIHEAEAKLIKQAKGTKAPEQPILILVVVLLRGKEEGKEKCGVVFNFLQGG